MFLFSKIPTPQGFFSENVPASRGTVFKKMTGGSQGQELNAALYEVFLIPYRFVCKWRGLSVSEARWKTRRYINWANCWCWATVIMDLKDQIRRSMFNVFQIFSDSISVISVKR